MTSRDPQVQRSLANEKCTPTKVRDGAFCHLSPICQRCERCIGHCLCPPREMRYQPKEEKPIWRDFNGRRV